VEDFCLEHYFISFLFQSLLRGFPDDSKKLDQYRKNLTGFQSVRWHDAWMKSVLPMFEDES